MLMDFDEKKKKKQESFLPLYISRILFFYNNMCFLHFSNSAAQIQLNQVEFIN